MQSDVQKKGNKNELLQKKERIIKKNIIQKYLSSSLEIHSHMYKQMYFINRN